MTWLTGIELDSLAHMINERLNQIHDEAIALFRALAKSTGQRTRSDRFCSSNVELTGAGTASALNAKLGADAPERN